MKSGSNNGLGTMSNSIVQARSQGKDVGIASFVYQNPQTASILSKLIMSDNHKPEFDKDGNRTVTPPRTNDLRNTSSRVAERAENAEQIMFIFSDVRVACEILIASIKAPNSMYEGEVNFTLRDNLHVIPLAEKLLPLVRTYFRDVYDLGAKLDSILRETLCGSGSMPIIIIPENSLTDLINGGSYSASKEGVATNPDSGKRFAIEALRGEFTKLGGKTTYPNVGLLGHGASSPAESTGLSLESLTKDVSLSEDESVFTINEGGHKIKSKLSFSDNAKNLQKNLLGEIARESKIQRAMERVSDKPEGALSDRDIANLFYRNRTGRKQEFIKLKTDNELKRYSVGRPYVDDLPPESVIPIISRSRRGKPVAVIVLLDREGAPLSRITAADQFKALQARKSKMSSPDANGAYGDMSSFLISKAAGAFGVNCDAVTFNQVADIHMNYVEAEINARIRNSFGTAELTPAELKAWNEIMLYRELSNMETQALLVPGSMITYFTYDQHPDGTGKTLLDDSAVISASRAQLLFARILGAVKNSVGRTRVSVDIDPGDPDAVGTMELIRGEVLNARGSSDTPSSLRASDIINQVQGMGIEFEVQGNDQLPNTKIGYSEISSSYNRPDDELMNELKDMTIDHIGVPPEMIDDARRAEFATVAVANNIMFSRRVRDYQARFDPQLTEFAVKMLTADVVFIKEIKKVIGENLDLVVYTDELTPYKDNDQALVELLCSEFISNIVCSLSRPDIKSLESNLEAMNKFEEIVDKAITYFFSEEANDASIIGEKSAAEQEATKAKIKSALMRRFIGDNNIVPELGEILTQSEDGSSMWDVSTTITSHSAMVAKLYTNIREQSARIAAAATVVNNEIDNRLSPPEADGGLSSATDSSSASSTDEADGGTGGGDELFDLDIPM